MASTVGTPTRQDLVTLVKDEHNQAHIATLPCKYLLNDCIRFFAAIFSEFDCKSESCETNEHE